MKNKISIYYDRKGDFLEIRLGKPVKSHYKNLGKDMLERIDDKTGQIMGFAIFNFKKRTQDLNEIMVPIPRAMKFVS